jgi:DNA repair exonuclease SbcCD ATPase subunit
MLILQEVRWANCFSYGEDNSLKLNENTITQLIGENGAGKSSISLIIQEALYNKNSKGIKKTDIVNRNLDTKHYWIELDFTYNGKQYTVKVNRKSSLKVNLIEDGTDISSHTATATFKTIEKILGIDYKVFVQLMYQSVQDGLSFLTATDSTRKKFLIDLFGLDEYDKYHTVFKELVKELNSEVSRVQGSLDSTKRWIEKNKDVGSKQETVPTPDEPETDEKLWELKDKASKVKEINRKINSNNTMKEMLETIEYDEKIAIKPKKETRELSQTLGGFEQTIKTQTAFVNKMKKLGDKCPTCTQDIDQDITEAIIEDAEAKIQDASTAKLNIEQQIKMIREENKRIDMHKKAKNEYESILVKVDHELESEIVNLDDIIEEIQEIERQSKELKKQYQEAIRKNQEIAAHNSRVEVISKQLEEHSAELIELDQKLRAIADKLAIAETLKKAFSTNGLVAHKLENLVKDIEQLANAYLAELSDGRFTLEFTISGDKLNVVLTDEGVDITIAALSSGETAKVNVATLLAIRKMMNSISKTQINILFLDEAINVLSETGRDCLIDVLLKEEGLNTFLVSHGWSHPLLSKVIISNEEDGISRLNYG